MDLQGRLADITERDWQQTATGRLRVAVVGLGWWTREFALPALEAAEHCVPTAAVSGSADKRREAAEAFDLEATLDYDEYADGVASEAYDAVYVCTPNTTHHEHVTAAARQGKPVLCEKPMDVDVERARSMVRACEDADVPLMVAYRLRTDPTMRRLGDRVQDGVVGRPRQIHAHMSQPLLDMRGSDDWRLDPSLVGHGAAVSDLGVYPLNIVRLLLGADPESVTATMSSSAEAFADVPDEAATFTLSFPEAVTAQCSVSENAALAGHLTVVGSEGALTLDGAFFGNETQRLRIDSGEETATATWTPPDQMRELFAYFADRVLTGGAIGPDGTHALVDVATTEAIYEAAASEQTVDIVDPCDV